jgi:hypothetical protein
METTTSAAAIILQGLRTIRQRGGSPDGTPACLWERHVPLAVRGAAFRLLNRKGLAVDVNDGRFAQRMWRATDKAMALQAGEELSAIA